MKKSFALENFLDCGKLPRSRKSPWLWETSLFVEKYFLAKNSLIKEKSLLGENFADQGKNFFEENFFDCEKLS